MSSENKYWAEARFEIQKYEARASFDEYCIRNLKSQIDTRDWDLRRTLESTWKPAKLKIDFNKKWLTEKELCKKSRRGFQEIESMKRNHEFYVDEFSRTKLQNNQNTINNLMDKVRESQCEINYMHDSKDVKDSESVHNGQLSHVPMIQRYFLTKMSEEICLPRPNYAAQY